MQGLKQGERGREQEEREERAGRVMQVWLSIGEQELLARELALEEDNFSSSPPPSPPSFFIVSAPELIQLLMGLLSEICNLQMEKKKQVLLSGSREEEEDAEEEEERDDDTINIRLITMDLLERCIEILPHDFIIPSLLENLSQYLSNTFDPLSCGDLYTSLCILYSLLPLLPLSPPLQYMSSTFFIRFLENWEQYAKVREVFVLCIKCMRKEII